MTNDVWPECGHTRDLYLDRCIRCEVAREVAREHGVPESALAAGLDRALAAVAAARAAARPDEVARSLEVARDRIERRRAGVLPETVSPLGSTIALPCTWFGNRESFAHVMLEFNERGAWCYDPTSRMRLLHRPWHEIADIAVEDSDAVYHDVSELRAASFGLISARHWNAPERCYVVVRTTSNARLFFEVNDDLETVRDILGNVTSWFAENVLELHQL
jgi:hypothetical protein